MNILGKEAQFSLGEWVKVIATSDPHTGKTAAIRSIISMGNPDHFVYDLEFDTAEHWYQEHELVHDPH